MKKFLNGDYIEMTPEEITARQAEESAWLQERITAHLPAYRYAKETGGVTINGVRIQTDRESRAILTGAYIRAKEDNEYVVRWKTPAGFVTLNSAQIIAISDSVADHVKKCYEAEFSVLENIGSVLSVQDVETCFDNFYRVL